MKYSKWMPILPALICSGAIGICSAPASGKSSGPSQSGREVYLPPLSAHELVEINNHFPLRKYSRFPTGVRKLMQRADFERDECRASPGMNGENAARVLIGCNLSYRASVLLEDRGWCWGGSDISAEQYWLSCKLDQRYVPGALRDEGDPFSPVDIREAGNEARNRH